MCTQTVKMKSETVHEDDQIVNRLETWSIVSTVVLTLFLLTISHQIWKSCPIHTDCRSDFGTCIATFVASITRTSQKCFQLCPPKTILCLVCVLLGFHRSTFEQRPLDTLVPGPLVLTICCPVGWSQGPQSSEGHLLTSKSNVLIWPWASKWCPHEPWSGWLPLSIYMKSGSAA